MNTHRTEHQTDASTALLIALLWIAVMVCRYAVWMIL